MDAVNAAAMAAGTPNWCAVLCRARALDLAATTILMGTLPDIAHRPGVDILFDIRPWSRHKAKHCWLMPPRR